ncbi:hypothetical protein [Cellulomonas dongxiuzhuiae]|uniref:Uncharacterized protein n=1 Tax=Cellulomonas dongxiuzhuiae TaxID=2819979 RepID=A0ABX8GL39_9CELL|nr:hypothetical protein [Cellulomonas dongxiuzhuiae]MBO3095590.1 hypothetical protein [Cellulomonas dongxiuzhuiae]QWC16558.1 hypothetical protein KKR89_02495 [Cellulomonas dongxiuzhuiae]
MSGSEALRRAGARWDDGPGAGEWIAPLLGELGPSVGHAVPLGYDAYAVVPLFPDGADDGADLGDEPVDGYVALARLLDALTPATGDQPVHCGLWEGFGFLFDHGTDPRYAPGMGVGVGWDPAGPVPDAAEIARARAEAEDALAARRLERPAADPLHLPHRAYHLWTGPLPAALALRDLPGDAPSLVWPEDRSWFVGVPIYTREVAVGASAAVVDALLADPGLAARRVEPGDVLDIDD